MVFALEGKAGGRLRVSIDIMKKAITFHFPLDCLRKMNILLSSVLALFVTSVTASTAMAQEVKGDAKAGAGKIATCIGCHGIKGYQASFPEIYRVPMISGQNAKYISTALAAYQKGERKHPTMRGIATTLSDQDMADVAAYYEGSGRKEGVTAPGKAPMATPRSPRWSRRAPVRPAMARVSASRSTPRIPRSPASMPTTCLSRSSPTRPKATPPGAATTV
jgi:cytochrome c553